MAAVAATGIAASSLMNIAGIFTIGTLAGGSTEHFSFRYTNTTFYQVLEVWLLTGLVLVDVDLLSAGSVDVVLIY